MPTEFVVYDFETTGLDTQICDVTEIGALKVKDGEVVGKFECLIKLADPLPPIITTITGITDAMLSEFGIDEREAFVNFKEFMGDLPAVGHNILGYDNAILARKFYKHLGLSEIRRKDLDTYALFKAHVDKIKIEKDEPIEAFCVRMINTRNKLGSRYSLGFAHQFLGCDSTGIVSHRAMGDVKMVLDIYKKLTI